MLLIYLSALLFAMPAAQVQTDAGQSLTPAQKAKLAPRRPTRQVVGSPLPTVTDGYRPTLTPREAASGTPDPIGTLPVHPTPTGVTPLAPLPVPLGSCSAGGCTGADGVRYNTGAAGVAVDPTGRTCHTVGTTVNCF
ncbi:hypothetical protein [Massilia sp. S19_KUP03_FR1]|uniref:hypothetical protein n=1 Tax=Massilia sp. S19_KUP03_FR1 TaxID=3025503 RepID=UPI002FCCD35A